MNERNNINTVTVNSIHVTENANLESSRNPSTENSNARIDPIQEQNPTQTNLQDRPVTLSSPDSPMSISDLKAKARTIITEYLKLPFDDDDGFLPDCDGWMAIEKYFSDLAFEGTAYGIEHIEKNPWRLYFIYAMDFVFNDVLKGICGTYRDIHTFGNQSVSQLFLLAVRLARLILSTPEPSRQILRIKILEIFNQFVRAYFIDRLNHAVYENVVWQQIRQEIQQILQPIILQQIMLQIQLEQQKQQEALEQLKRDISEIKFQQNDISILEYFDKCAAAHYAFITQADVHTPLLLNIPTLQEFMHQIFEYCCIVPSSVEKINDICVLKIIEYVQQFHALFPPEYLSPTIRDVIRLHVYDILDSHQVNFSSDFQAYMDLSAKMLSVVENFPKGQILANVPDRETLRRNIAQIRSQQGQISTLKYFNECAKTYYAFIIQSSARAPFLLYTPTLQEFMNQVFEYCCIIPNSVKNIRSECVLRIIEYIQKFHTQFPLDISLPSVQYIIIQHICNILEIYEVKFSQNAQSSMEFFEKLLSVGEHLPEYQRDQLVATFNDILHNHFGINVDLKTLDKNTQFAIIRKLANKIKHDIPTTREIINILDETMDIFNEDNVKSILNASVLAKVDIKTKARIFLARYGKLFPEENSYFSPAIREEFAKIDPYLKGENSDNQDPCIQDFNNAMNFVFDDVLIDICGMNISHDLPKSSNFNNQAHNWIWLTVQFARTVISGSELPQEDLKKAIARNYRKFANRCRLTRLTDEVFSRKIEWAQPGEDEVYVRQQAFEIVQTADNLAENISQSNIPSEYALGSYTEIAMGITFSINQRYDRPIGELQEEVRRLRQIERVTREILSFTQHNLTNAQNVYGFTVSDTSMPRIGLRAIMQHDLDEAFVDLPVITEIEELQEEVQRLTQIDLTQIDLTQIERAAREILSSTQHNSTSAQNGYGFTVSDIPMPRIDLRAMIQHDLDNALVDLPAATETRSGFEEGHTGVEQELEQEQEVEQEQEDQLEREFEIQLITHPQHAPEQQTPLPQRGPHLLRAIENVLRPIFQNIR